MHTCIHAYMHTCIHAYVLAYKMRNNVLRADMRGYNEQAAACLTMALECDPLNSDATLRLGMIKVALLGGLKIFLFPQSPSRPDSITPLLDHIPLHGSVIVLVEAMKLL